MMNFGEFFLIQGGSVEVSSKPSIEKFIEFLSKSLWEENKIKFSLKLNNFFLSEKKELSLALENFLYETAEVVSDYIEDSFEMNSVTFEEEGINEILNSLIRSSIFFSLLKYEAYQKDMKNFFPSSKNNETLHYTYSCLLKGIVKETFENTYLAS